MPEVGRRAQGHGAGLYAMAGPAFDPDATIALPTASIAATAPGGDRRGHHNQLQAIEHPHEPRRPRSCARSTPLMFDILHLVRSSIDAAHPSSTTCAAS